MADIDQLCDRVAFIVDGEIKEMDTPRNLKMRYGKRTMKLEYKENKTLLLDIDIFLKTTAHVLFKGDVSL